MEILIYDELVFEKTEVPSRRLETSKRNRTDATPDSRIVI